MGSFSSKPKDDSARKRFTSTTTGTKSLNKTKNISSSKLIRKNKPCKIDIQSQQPKSESIDYNPSKHKSIHKKNPNLNVCLFGDNNQIGNNNHFDLSNSLISMHGLGIKKKYKPKINPTKGIKNEIKQTTTTHQENIRKSAFVYSLVPHLTYPNQMQSLFNSLPLNGRTIGTYIHTLSVGRGKLSRPKLYKVHNDMVELKKNHPRIKELTYDKIAIYRYNRHITSKNASNMDEDNVDIDDMDDMDMNGNENFNLDFIYKPWIHMNNFDIIALECALSFTDNSLLLTDSLNLTGSDILNKKYMDVKEMSEMEPFCYGNKATEQVWSLIVVMKKVICFQKWGKMYFENQYNE